MGYLNNLRPNVGGGLGGIPKRVIKQQSDVSSGGVAATAQDVKVNVLNSTKKYDLVFRNLDTDEYQSLPFDRAPLGPEPFGVSDTYSLDKTFTPNLNTLMLGVNELGSLFLASVNDIYKIDAETALKESIDVPQSASIRGIRIDKNTGNIVYLSAHATLPDMTTSIVILDSNYNVGNIIEFKTGSNTETVFEVDGNSTIHLTYKDPSTDRLIYRRFGLDGLESGSAAFLNNDTGYELMSFMLGTRYVNTYRTSSGIQFFVNGVKQDGYLTATSGNLPTRLNLSIDAGGKMVGLMEASYTSTETTSLLLTVFNGFGPNEGSVSTVIDTVSYLNSNRFYEHGIAVSKEGLYAVLYSTTHDVSYVQILSPSKEPLLKIKIGANDNANRGSMDRAIQWCENTGDLLIVTKSNTDSLMVQRLSRFSNGKYVLFGLALENIDAGSTGVVRTTGRVKDGFFNKRKSIDFSNNGGATLLSGDGVVVLGNQTVDATLDTARPNQTTREDSIFFKRAGDGKSYEGWFGGRKIDFRRPNDEFKNYHLMFDVKSSNARPEVLLEQGLGLDKDKLLLVAPFNIHTTASVADYPIMVVLDTTSDSLNEPTKIDSRMGRYQPYDTSCLYLNSALITNDAPGSYFKSYYKDYDFDTGAYSSRLIRRNESGNTFFGYVPYQDTGNGIPQTYNSYGRLFYDDRYLLEIMAGYNSIGFRLSDIETGKTIRSYGTSSVSHFWLGESTSRVSQNIGYFELILDGDYPILYVNASYTYGAGILAMHFTNGLWSPPTYFTVLSEHNLYPGNRTEKHYLGMAPTSKGVLYSRPYSPDGPTSSYFTSVHYEEIEWPSSRKAFSIRLKPDDVGRVYFPELYALSDEVYMQTMHYSVTSQQQYTLHVFFDSTGIKRILKGSRIQTNLLHNSFKRGLENSVLVSRAYSGRNNIYISDHLFSNLPLDVPITLGIYESTYTELPIDSLVFEVGEPIESLREAEVDQEIQDSYFRSGNSNEYEYFGTIEENKLNSFSRTEEGVRSKLTNFDVSDPTVFRKL